MKNQRYVGVMVKCGDKILLCKRNNIGSYPGMWSIPGGKLEGDESTQDGARREFLEETNVDIKDMELNFIGLIPRHTRDGKKVKGLMYVYLLNVDEFIEPDLENAVDGEEHTDWDYFSLSGIKPETSGEYMHKLAEIILK
jgi:ADP-ribose pyrophosphatase YjhB (NUDIX family)